VYATPSELIRRVAKISIGIEGLLNTKAIPSLLLQTSPVPILLFTSEQPPLSYGHDIFFVIHFVSVMPKKMEEQLAERLGIFLAIALQCV
jgi:hypothetical protein